MDRATRVIILYSRLIHGEKIKKDVFCVKYGISTRTFDRDIDVIRAALSELYSAHEVIYDKKINQYYITGEKNAGMMKFTFTDNK
jgi:predicted DNA-binding transcriptional regulator YafY